MLNSDDKDALFNKSQVSESAALPGHGMDNGEPCPELGSLCTDMDEPKRWGPVFTSNLTACLRVEPEVDGT